MHSVAMEDAGSRLAEIPFAPEEFPYAFLEAFGNKETTLNRRRSEAARPNDLPPTNFRSRELRDFPAEIARLA